MDIEIAKENKDITNEELAFRIYNKVQEALREQNKMFLIIGQALKLIRENELYKYMGNGGFETFGDFINNPEIGLKQSTAYLYIRVFEYYVERLEFTEKQLITYPLNRLMKLLPHLKKKSDEEAKELLTNIGNMTDFDYNIEVKEKKLNSKKPALYLDKETGLYILDFEENQMLRIYNKTENKVLWEKQVNITI